MNLPASGRRHMFTQQGIFMKTIQRYMGIVFQNSTDGEVRYDLFMTDAWETEEQVIKALEEAKEEILELFERNGSRAYKNATGKERDRLFADMLDELRIFRLRHPEREMDVFFEDTSVRVKPMTVHLS